MKAVILAGGLGTRLSEETDLKPKPMIEIGGKPMLWHIMKMYSAHLKGLDYLNENSSQSIELNLGSGHGSSVREVVQKVKEETGSDFTVIEEARRPGDPSVLVASEEKAKSVLKLRPSLHNLRSVIRSLI